MSREKEVVLLESSNPIKEIRITLAKEPGTLKAFASVTLEVASGHSLVLRGLRVIEGAKGLFVSYPAQKSIAPADAAAAPDGSQPDGAEAAAGEGRVTYYDQYFFLEPAANDDLKSAVLFEFLRVAAQ